MQDSAYMWAHERLFVKEGLCVRGYTLHKTSVQLFDTWQLNQDIFSDDLVCANKDNEKRSYEYYQRLKMDYQGHPGALRQLEVLWSGKNGNPFGHIKACAQKALADTSIFIDYLKQNQFCNKEIYVEERSWSINKVIHKYNKLIRLLFMHVSYAKQNRLLYIVANNFFMFCFNPASHEIDGMMTQHNLEPLARMMYAIMWKHLCSRGWQSWHKKIIDTLEFEVKKGDEVVYIAGGSDINQLLKNKIYTIRIIDPFLPTQDTYYSRGWRFLVKGIVGDTIEWSLGSHTVCLKRSYYQEHGTFTALLSSGKKRRVPKATIIWDVYNDKKQKCGQVTIERRFTEQTDFDYKKNKKILISFNELYFITTIHEDGWGIDVDKFDPRFEIYVKQLNRSLSKDVLMRMREIDDAFEFIQLGNCIN